MVSLQLLARKESVLQNAPEVRYIVQRSYVYI